jgi:putative intracellular protease/amidase
MPAAIDTTRRSAKQVLMVVANPCMSELTGWPVGFWASEFIHPWYVFSDVGYEVTLASPDGGKVEIDFLSDPDDRSGYSREDVLSRGFLATYGLTAMFEDTPRLGELDLDEYDAVIVCGGQAAMYQFREHAGLQQTLMGFYERQKPTAAMCHGVASLIDLRLTSGDYLIAGKTITGYSNLEEEAADQVAGKPQQPWRIEDAARERGANFVHGGIWKPYAVRDGRLITGQQQYSAKRLAELVIAALGT